MSLARAMLAVSTYVFPLVASPLLVWAWWRIAGGDWRLVALVLAVPLVFGYIVAWVATGIIKRWRVTGGWRIGAHMFGGWLHDLHAIREGRIEFVGLDARAAEEALASFAPASYFTIGATYAAVTIWGWRLIVEHPASFPLVFAGALAVLFVVPSAVVLALDPESRRRV